MKSKKKVFIIAPYTSRFNKQFFDFQLKETIELIAETLQNNNCETIFCHNIENWGRNTFPPEVFVPRDYEWMKESDLILMYIDSNLLSGIYIELGWAVSLKKDIIIFLKKEIKSYNHPIPSMIYGLHKISNIQIIEFTNTKEVLEYLKKETII